MNYTPKLNVQASALIGGEEVIHGVRGFLDGSNWFIGAFAGGGVFLGFIISNSLSQRNGAILAGAVGAALGVIVGYFVARLRYKSSPYISLGVTASKVVVFERGFLGKVERVLQEIPIPAIDGFSVSPTNILKPAKIEIRTEHDVYTYTAPSSDDPQRLEDALNRTG